MRLISVPMMLALAAPFTQAADMAAGKAKAEAVCAACHGVNGVSVADAIPNLAGQKAAYLEAQLKSLKDGTRKNAVMAAIASQLSADDIANVAAHFAGLPVAGGAQKSDFLPQLARSAVPFPEDYKASYVRYHTINFPATKQVRHYYANPLALKAAREGRALPDGSLLLAEVHAAKLDADNKPIIGADGFYQPDKLLFYTAMGRDKGWGAAVPDMLRNEDWNYAAFTTAKQPRPGVNQAECLACHKPLDKQSYTFTIKELASAAMR